MPGDASGSSGESSSERYAAPTEGDSAGSELAAVVVGAAGFSTAGFAARRGLERLASEAGTDVPEATDAE